MVSQHNFTNNFGRRLLPSVLDQVAATHPNRLYASIPVADQISQGYQDITFQQIKNAVDHLAWSISETHGQSKDFTTICYIGEPDLRTAVVFLAAVKCGYKVRGASMSTGFSTYLYRFCLYHREIQFQRTLLL